MFTFDQKLLIIFVVSIFSSGALASTVFIFRDAGETLGLLPVLQTVVESGEEAYGIALCCASAELAEKYPFIFTLQDIGISQPDLHNRSVPIPSSVNRQIMIQLNSWQVTTMITGLVSEAQHQIAKHVYTNTDIPVIGFDDSYAMWSDSTMSAKFATEPSIATLTVTAEAIKADAVRTVKSQVVVTGSPTTDIWSKAALDTVQIAEDRKSLHLGEKRAIVFFGEYDDTGNGRYEKNVEEYAKLIALTVDKYSFVFSPHPGYDGSLEMSIFAKAGVDGFVVLAPSEMSSPRVAAAIDVTIAMTSTCLVQSLFGGTPSISLQTSQPYYHNVVDSMGLIRLATNASDASLKIEETGFKFDVDKLDNAGLPRDSVDRLLQLLK